MELSTFSKRLWLKKLGGIRNLTGTRVTWRGVKSVRGQKKLKLKKKKPSSGELESSKQRIQSGERKAWRRRVFFDEPNDMSLTSATVEGLACGAEAMTKGTFECETMQGKMVEIKRSSKAQPSILYDQLSMLEAFKPHQLTWKLFGRPIMQVTKDTIDMAKWLNDTCKAENEAAKSFAQCVLVGARKSGKSVLLLQMMANALLNEWVVVSIPEARDLTSGFTDYAPVSKVDKPNGWEEPDWTAFGESMFVQPTYTAGLLKKIGEVNKKVLSKLFMSTNRNTYKLPFPVTEDTSLYQLCTIGAGEVKWAWATFEALWAELTVPNMDRGMDVNTKVGVCKEERPPILLVTDGFGHFMRRTAYPEANTKRNRGIHALDFTLIRHFVSCLTSRKNVLPNGGGVIAALSESDRPSSKTLDFLLARIEAMRKGKNCKNVNGTSDTLTGQTSSAQQLALPHWNAYEKIDTAVLKMLTHDEPSPSVPKYNVNDWINIWRMGQLNENETFKLMEFYDKCGLGRKEGLTKEHVRWTWLLSGKGVIGELERCAIPFLRN